MDPETLKLLKAIERELQYLNERLARIEKTNPCQLRLPFPENSDRGARE